MNVTLTLNKTLKIHQNTTNALLMFLITLIPFFAPAPKSKIKILNETHSIDFEN